MLRPPDPLGGMFRVRRPWDKCSDWVNVSRALVLADLTGSNRCSALGIVARAYSPVLSLCRDLVAAGHDPTRSMQVYRGATLCLTVRAIGEGAGLAVEDGSGGTPTFVLFRDRARGTGAASPVRLNGQTQ